MPSEDLLKKLKEFCRKNRSKATQASSGVSLSFNLSMSRNTPTPIEIWMKSFLSGRGRKFREGSGNVLRGFSITDPISQQDKKMLGLIYHDKNDNGDNEDLFEISPNNIKHLKPKEAKKEYPEYGGYHRGNKRYFK